MIIMNVQEMYLDALKDLSGWVTVWEWATHFCEKFPDMYAKAEEEAKNQKQDTTGLREISARISSRLSRGSFSEFIELDESERPRKIRYLPENEISDHIEKDIEDDIAPLTRQQIIKKHTDELSTNDLYRIREIESIIEQLKLFFKLDFEFEHANAILNKETPGRHHPDNIQILLKTHNRIKNSNNWIRFTIDEQIEYILSVIKVQKIVSSKMNINLDDSVVDKIIDRLRLVY
jgi:hypothetical protein